MTKSASDVVAEAIERDRQDLIDLCLAIGNLTDYAGHETHVGRAVTAWLESAGIETWLQYLSETSVNAVGVLRGRRTGGVSGRSLIFNAHMDTQGFAPKGGPEAERKLRGAWFKDDLLYGQGLANDKAQLAAEMIAVRAIKRAGIALAGDLFVTGVAQETSEPLDRRPPAGRALGPLFSQTGEGAGARWLVANGVVADFALVGEVSDFCVSIAQAGFLRVRVAVPGVVAYTPALVRGPKPGDSPNPFERAAVIVGAIEAWARRYEAEHARDFAGGRFVPRAQVYEIASSGPAWTETTDYCYVFVDIRLAPGDDPAPIQRSLQAALDTTGIPCTLDPYDHQRGYIPENAEPLLEALRRAHRRVLGNDLAFANSVVHSMWRDGNAFNEAGIPAIGYGPGTRDAGGGLRGLAGVPRPIAVDDLLATAKVFALTALDICGIAAPEAAPAR
jgi:acetylornithine deacetylase/succinyl-diaminopimelate desuccinylase-like protein